MALRFPSAGVDRTGLSSGNSSLARALAVGRTNSPARKLSESMSVTPISNLPKNFQPREAEEKWRRFWERGGFFRANNESVREAYTIVIPPPNVTGALHLGHGLVQTIQDVLIRHRRMAGYNTLWVPGTDHAGIATQHVVVEKLRAEGRSKEELGREDFLAEAWKWKEEYHTRITDQIKTLGCSCDWEREAFTLDAQRARAVRTAFKLLYEKGLIYRGKYMVNWDPVSLTAVSDDEVEYEEEDGHLWHLKYPFTDGSGRYAIVATTRPETMLGDTAVAVHPSDKRYKDLIGKEVELPLTGRRLPIIADEFVKSEFGSGMVKITPGHDPNDFQCGLRHNLEIINVLNPDATMNENVPERYRGLDRYEARERVVEDLTAQGLIDKTEPHEHRVGRGYRSKAAIEPRLSDQWFVKIGPLAEQAVRAVRKGEVRLIPKQQENTYFAWMENVRDWCISRQLWWGHRIPVWYHKDDPERMVCWDGDGEPPEVQAEPDAWEQDTDVLDTWFSSALWPFSTLGWPDDTKDLRAFFPTSVLVTGHDILFFWVARMVMMSYELTDKPPFRDVFLHGLIFGKSYYRKRGGDLELIPPAERRVLGLDDMDKLPPGIDFRWEKMSKSKGNVIDPLEMFEIYGVDPVRIALVAYSGQGRTIEIDRQRIAGYRNFINKLWNASRFVLGVTEDVAPKEFRHGPPPEGLEAEDRWILSRLSATIAEASDALHEYAFDRYVSSIYQFLWGDYCDWYLELTKGRVYGTDPRTTPESGRAAKVVLLTVLEHVLRLLHPVIPYATEEVWQLLRERLTRGAALGEHAQEAPPRSWEAHGLPGFRDGFEEPSICIAEWPADRDYTDDAASQAVALVQQTLGAVRNIRGEMKVPADTKVEVLVAHGSKDAREVLEGFAERMRGLGGIARLDIAAEHEPAPFASTHASGGLSIQVLLPEELRAKEAERLKKELAKLEKGYNATKGKLGNEKFLQSAPPAVVEREKEKLAGYEADLASLRERIAALGG